GRAAAGRREQANSDQRDDRPGGQGTCPTAAATPLRLRAARVARVARVAGIVFHGASPGTGWVLPTSPGCTAPAVSGRFRSPVAAAFAPSRPRRYHRPVPPRP